MIISFRMADDYKTRTDKDLELLKPHRGNDTNDGVPTVRFDRRMVVKVLYTNYANKVAWRDIVPLQVEWTDNQWHRQQQWLLHAYDIEKGAVRSFAMKDIVRWEPVE